MDSLPFSREDLLGQTAWLHSLARQLAVQPSDADDATQQTWMQALRAVPSGVRDWRPFLATTLRNVVALTGRAERRRSARHLDSAAGGAGHAESTADLVARIELHRHLAALVLELPEPQRELVLRHYFAGDTIAELAARSGTTTAAVRGHLHRARACLRQRVEAADGEPRRAFVALVGASTPCVVPAVAAVAMKTKSLVIVAALAVAALLVWQLVPADTALSVGQPRQSAVPIAAAAGDDDQRSATVDAGPPVRTGAESSDAVWVVRGEVMHGSVAPLPGASFIARVFAAGHEDGPPLQEVTLTSDASGAFEWAMKVPRGAVTLAFAQSRPETTIMANSRTVLDGEAPPQDVTVFAFVKDCQVTGKVLDDTKRPIAGAWVKASSRDAPTPCSAGGEYRLVTSATYGDTAVVAGAPGHVVATRTVTVRGRAATVAIDFALKPAARLAGRVVDENGTPVAGGSVCTYETYSAAVTSDADGRFEISHLDPVREQHTVQFEHADYLTTRKTISSRELAAPCELVVARGARVRGSVLGPDGRAVAGARVRLGAWTGMRGDPSGVSREDGSFELRNAPPGSQDLMVNARGCAPGQRTVDVPAGVAEVVGVEVQLERGHSVSGRLMDRDGQGLHRIRITAFAGRAYLGPQLGADVYTARDGSFRLVDLPAGAITLDCFGMDVARKEVSGVAVDRHDVMIVMERCGRLAGRVVDDATGAPLTKFSIRFVEPELKPGEQHGGGYGVEWSNGLVFEDANGGWNTDTERFEPGAVFGVEASADGYGPAVQRRAIARPEPNPDELVLRLRKAARITGRVVDQRSGKGIEGARVAMVAGGPHRERDGLDEARMVRTDEGGAFAIEGVPAGSVSLVVRHADWPLTLDGPFATAAGETTMRVVSVVAGARLTGMALDAHGAPVAGAHIGHGSVEIAGVRVPDASTTTDVAGRFLFPGLATARYWLHGSGRLGDGSFLAWSRYVDVVAGNDVDLPLMPAGDGAIECELTSEGRVPESMSVRIWRRDANGLDDFPVTVTGSSFVVRGLPAGDFLVHVSSGNWNAETSGNGSVTVTAGATAKLRIAVALHTR